MKERLGEQLLAAGLITPQQLEEALEEHQASGRFLGRILVAMGALSEDDLVRIVSEQLDVPVVDLKSARIDPAAAQLYPADLARKNLCFPYQIDSGVLSLAMSDPFDVGAMEDLAFISGREVQAALAKEGDLLHAIEQHSPAVRPEGADKILEEVDQTLDRSRSSCQTISILSNKGGVGKTHLAVNLAYFLARNGKKVLLVDADMGNADISHKLNFYPKVTLLDLLDAQTPPDGLIARTPYGFDLIGGHTGDVRLANLKYIQRVSFVKHFVRLGQPYDYVLLDLGAGISSQVIDFGLAADNTVILTTVRDIVSGYACAKVAFLRHIALQRKLAACDPAGRTERFFCPWVIVNQLSYEDQGPAIFERLSSTACHHLNARIADHQIMPQYLGGVLYDHDSIRKAEAKREPLGRMLPRSKPARCYEKIARQLINPLEPETGSSPWRGLSRLARILRLRPDELDVETVAC